jgi:hypothetical protein
MVGAKIQFGAPLQHGQARQARLRIVPLARHAPMLNARAEQGTTLDKEDLWPASDPVWIPATMRPAAADVKELSPTFAWSSSTVLQPPPATSHRQRISGLRLVLRRPWFSAGECERVGIVFWPPPVLNLPFPKTGLPRNELDELSPDELDQLTEEDLGPLGRFASVWGADPLEGAPVQTSRNRFMSWSHFRLPEDAMKHPRVLLPLPADEPETAGHAAQPEKIVEVSVLSFFPTFEPGAIDAYVDLDLTPLGGVPDPMIRLGIVRLQPNSREDAPPAGIPDRPGVRCSPPVTVHSRLLPARRLSVTSTAFDVRHGAPREMTSVAVTLSGPAPPIVGNGRDARVTLELRERFGGEELPVLTANGAPACATWAGKDEAVKRSYANSEASWTASFLLAGSLASRDIVAIGTEDDILGRACKKDDHDCPPDNMALPRFVGAVELRRSS